MSPTNQITLSPTAVTDSTHNAPVVTRPVPPLVVPAPVPPAVHVEKPVAPPAASSFVPPVQTSQPIAHELPLPETDEENLEMLKNIQQASAAAVAETAANVSKGELATILEGFARVLRNDANYTSVSYTEHVAEVSQLKELLMEAQETIINLLNDRVFDRAKLARLEAEVRLLPDLQAQSNRALNLAAQSEEVQKELAHVRAEVERLRTSYMRTSEQKPAGWWSRFFKARD